MVLQPARGGFKVHRTAKCRVFSRSGGSPSFWGRASGLCLAHGGAEGAVGDGEPAPGPAERSLQLRPAGLGARPGTRHWREAGKGGRRRHSPAQHSPAQQVGERGGPACLGGEGCGPSAGLRAPPPGPPRGLFPELFGAFRGFPSWAGPAAVCSGAWQPRWGWFGVKWSKGDKKNTALEQKRWFLPS